MGDGYEATGRAFWGPTDRWVELLRPGGIYTGLHLHREYRDAHPLVEALTRGEAFFKAPGVPGLAPLVDHQPGRGLLIFATGPVWPLCQILALCRRDGAPSLHRATVEWLARAARALDEAQRAADPVGFHSHRSLNPWRIAIRPDGQVRLLGYGIPQLDLCTDEGKLDVDSYRWCPPERLNDGDEDPTSDLLALALMGFQLLTGQSLFEGDAERVRTAAERGLGPERLHRWREVLGAPLHEALERALQYHPDQRYRSVGQFHEVFSDLATSPTLRGPTLEELLGWLADQDGPAPAHAPPGAEPLPAAEPPRWQQINRRRAPSRPTTEGPRRRTRRRAPPDHNAMYPPEPLGPRAVRVQVMVEGESHSTRLDPSESLARSAARLVDVLEFSPVDLCGRIRGWYRIVQGDDAWYGDVPTSAADLQRPLQLEWIPNEELELRIEAEGCAPLHTRVGTAIHAQFLIGELRRLLDLEGANWQLLYEGRALDPWQVLDDLALREGAALQLRPQRRRRIG